MYSSFFTSTYIHTHTHTHTRIYDYQFSLSAVSNSLRPNELQHARPPCPTNYQSLLKLMSTKWVMPSNNLILSSCPQSFPASRSFKMSQFFASDGQSIGVSASASILLMNIQDWFPLGWTGWISVQAKGLSFPTTPQFKSINSSVLSFLYSPTFTSIHDYWKP